ncbi:MAG: MBOAT family O-acyltransferase [Acutalibacteraceae bacterium]|uniref:MBOAT family O-acyltransferase n=1 Tax=Candidatus Fimivicinus sp. TaxID=3056640 RepID=UPI003A499873
MMSLLFYAWGEPKWIILMIVTTLIDYGAGLLVDQYRGQKLAKWALAGSVVITLSFLAVFKYLGFFNQNLNQIFGAELPTQIFNLPIGISFYTFQAITYVVDVYRGKAQVQRSYANLLLYVALFPQLIAGPIVRYTDIAAQLENREMTLPGFSKGITRFVTGLGKKVLLANIAGQVATSLIGGDLSKASVLGAWLGIFAYTFQIYFDFSGYSDMAIGLGHMFGFTYVENFNYPYISKSITEFWRRWHISLSTFFRDYVYIPLGGNRRHQLRNMFIVWALTGLWHGASWNFVLWGLYYFVFLAIEKLFLGKFLEKLPAVVGHAYALFIIVVGWVFFYFDDVSRLGQMLKLMFGFSGQAGVLPTDTVLLKNHLVFFLVAIIACIPVSKLVKALLIRFSRKGSVQESLAGAAGILYDVALLFFSTAALVGASYNPFLYFRF